MDKHQKDDAGAKLTLTGKAADAKAGAVLLLDDGRVVYIGGLDCWSPELHGKRLTATGVLKTMKYIPDPVVDKDGAISQGAEGDQLVLENVRWKLAPAI